MNLFEKSEELLNETKRAEEVVNLRLKELETQETNRAIAREKQQRTQIHLQEIREAKSRAESDTRALHVELNSLEKQEILMQSEINQQIALQSRLVDELPQLEDHEAQSIERTKAIENRRQELETLATELGAKRSDIDVRSASINERENYLKGRLTEIENRLQGYTSERDQAEARRVTLEKRSGLAHFLRGIVVQKENQLETELQELRESRFS